MSIYENIYNLINTYIYGGGIVDGSFEELVCILLSTCSVLFAFAIPFIVVFGLIKFISSLV